MAVREDSPVPTPRDVAREVAGGEPPEWLVEHFRSYAASMMIPIAAAKMSFTRAEARTRLTNLSHAARLLRLGIGHALTCWLLEGEKLGKIPNRGELLRALLNIEERAKTMLDLPALKNTDGSAPRGRGRFRPGGGENPKIMVAGMIALAWIHVRGRKPGLKNSGAWRAADLFWRYACSLLPKELDLQEAAPRGPAYDGPSQWRWHFVDAYAVSPVLGLDHDEYMRHLHEAEASEARLKGD